MAEDINDLRARITELEATLYAERDALRLLFKFSNAKSHIVALLMSCKSIDKTMIEETLNVVTDIKVAICTLRKQLEPWGIKVHSKRGYGYWIDDETKARIKTMLADAANTELHSE
jgi:chromosome condensin MukBEF ATPase and DNA-binding subunit MukB